MNIGKVPENVLKRSILKKINNRRSEVLIGAGVGEDCAVLALSEDEVFVVTTNPIVGKATEIGSMAVLKAANNLAAEGAEPIGILVDLILPEDATEPEIQQVMDDLDRACGENKMQIIGGNTSVSDAVNKTLISITGIGKATKGKTVSSSGAKAGNDIVITKWIGLEGTQKLAKEFEAELKEKFPVRMIYEARNFDKLLSVVPEAALAIKSGVTAMHDVTEGGIFAALWEMAEASSVGLEIDIKAIPIKQETIEICNYFDLNPYGLISGGAMLMATEDGNKLVAELKKENIQATVVGKATDSNDRVLINGETRRFLERPKTDEIRKIKE